MTFYDWFLIQSPTIQIALTIKSIILLVISFPLMCEGRKKIAIFIFILASIYGTTAMLIPGKDEVKQIQELRRK